MIDSVLNVVRSCDDVILATCGDMSPDVRHLTNALNRGTADLNLYFMTGRGTPKYNQLQQNPHCTLYYFNPTTRHAVRLYGKIEFVVDMAARKKYWRDEYCQFGYGGPEDADFALLRFILAAYKFYVGNELKVGKI